MPCSFIPQSYVIAQLQPLSEGPTKTVCAGVRGKGHRYLVITYIYVYIYINQMLQFSIKACQETKQMNRGTASFHAF